MKKFNRFMMITIAIILVIGAISEVKSEVISDYNLKPYFFGGIYVPLEKNQDYTISRMRIGVNASRNSFIGNVDWNAGKACLHTAFGGFTDTVYGFKGTVIGGRFLNPVWHVWPGPRLLEQTRWSATSNYFSCLSNGLKGTLEKGKLQLIAANYSGGTSATINYGNTWLYWEDMVGFGMNLTINYPKEIAAWLPGFTIGYSHYKDGGNVMSEITGIDLTKNLRLYSQVDMNDQSTETLTGLTYVYDKNGGFAKVYYDSVSKWIAEFTFTF